MSVGRVHHPFPVAEVNGQHDGRLGAVLSESLEVIQSLDCHTLLKFAERHAGSVEDFHRDISELPVKPCGDVGSPCRIPFGEGILQIRIDDLGPVPEYPLQEDRGKPCQPILDGER